MHEVKYQTPEWDMSLSRNPLAIEEQADGFWDFVSEQGFALWDGVTIYHFTSDADSEEEAEWRISSRAPKGLPCRRKDPLQPDANALLIDSAVLCRAAAPMGTDEGNRIVFVIEPDRLSESCRQIFSGMQIDLEAVRKNYPCALGSSQLYRQWITEMFALSKDGLHRGIEVYKLRFLELLLYIQNFNPQQEALCRYYQHCKKQKIEKIEAFLTQHLTERPTIEELSERFLISKTALKQAFKDLYGMPIYTYMIHYRMETGRQLLVETRRSITEIANALGYTNVSKFSACFAKIYGMQPSRYRNTHWMKTGVEGIVL